MGFYGKTLAAALFLASGAMAQAQDVRIAYSTGSFAFVPFFATEVLGYFDEAGVNVEVIRAGSGSKTMAAVAGGSADMAVGSSGTILYARKEGLDLQMFATLVNQYSSSLALSKEWSESQGITEDSPVEARLAALKGARIATSGPGGGDQIIRYLADLAGLNPDRDMTIIHLGNDMGVYIAALQEGRIDGLALSEPTPHLAKREAGATIAFDLAQGDIQELDGFPYIVVHGRESWLKENQETVRKVYAAFAKTLNTLNDPAGAEDAREKVRTAYYPDVDAELFAELWQSAVKSVPETPETTPEQITGVAEFLNRFEENKIEPADLEGITTTEYATTP